MLYTCSRLNGLTCIIPCVHLSLALLAGMRTEGMDGMIVLFLPFASLVARPLPAACPLPAASSPLPHPFQPTFPVFYSRHFRYAGLTLVLTLETSVFGGCGQGLCRVRVALGCIQYTIPSFSYHHTSTRGCMTMQGARRQGGKEARRRGGRDSDQRSMMSDVYDEMMRR
jgi:hypothetical protein